MKEEKAKSKGKKDKVIFMGSSLEDWCLLAASAVWIRAAVANKAAHQVTG